MSTPQSAWFCLCLVFALSLAACGSDPESSDPERCSVRTARDVALELSCEGAQGADLLVQRAPEHGSVTVRDSVATYAPAAGYHGQDTFTLEADDTVIDVDVDILDAEGMVVGRELYAVTPFVTSPGAVTFAVDVTEEGVVVGNTTDAEGQHGFVRELDGRVELIDVPGAAGTLVESIADDGSVAGQWTDAEGIPTGFVRRAGSSTFEDPSLPGAVATYVQWVESDGTIAGGFDDTVVDDPFLRARKGFIQSGGGDLRVVEYPGASRTFVLARNAAGDIAGFFDDALGRHGFRGPEGDLGAIDAEGASGFTVTAGIEPDGTVVGFYLQADVARGFVVSPTGEQTTFARAVSRGTSAYRSRGRYLVGWSATADFSASEGWVAERLDVGPARPIAGD